MTRSRRMAAIAAAPILALGIATAAHAENVRIDLESYQEVPAISTPGTGQFSAEISDTSITYELSYSGLQGAVTQVHIHFGQLSVNGGITAFLCSNLGNGPVGTQACPAAPATITGTIEADDIGGGGAAQGIAANEFAEVVAAIRAKAAYVNVHTDLFPSGEIRGQLPKNPGALGDSDEN